MNEREQIYSRAMDKVTHKRFFAVVRIVDTCTFMKTHDNQRTRSSRPVA